MCPDCEWFPFDYYMVRCVGGTQRGEDCAPSVFFPPLIVSDYIYSCLRCVYHVCDSMCKSYLRWLFYLCPFCFVLNLTVLLYTF